MSERVINIPTIVARCNWAMLCGETGGDLIELGAITQILRKAGYSAHAEAEITTTQRTYKISVEVKRDEPDAILKLLAENDYDFTSQPHALADVHCRGMYVANCDGTTIKLRLWDAFKEQS